MSVVYYVMEKKPSGKERVILYTTSEPLALEAAQSQTQNSEMIPLYIDEIPDSVPCLAWIDRKAQKTIEGKGIHNGIYIWRYPLNVVLESRRSDKITSVS